MIWLPLILGAEAVSPRLEYEQGYANGGTWYRGYDNDSATLAWGESYVLMSLAAMFRATGDPVYLERLDLHLQDIYAARDDVRGVTDYRGASGACWRNTHYQPGGEGYCYVVHTGMLIYPMAEFARGVQDAGLADWTAADGQTFGDKAAFWTTAAQESVAAHDDQWREDGTYVFRADAPLTYAGVDVPFNQSNTMGRALLSLYDVTGDAQYLDKATGLATRFRADITFSGGQALWNYWGGAYASPGEDISHAAINADFIAMAAERGVVFSDEDAEAVAETFVSRVLLDDATSYDFVGGGTTNTSSYRAQLGRWAALTPWRPAVYTGIYDLFRDDYPGASAGTTTLLAWALLSEHELPRCVHFFYYVDWDDQGDWYEATAYSANLLTKLPDAACMIPLSVERPTTTHVQQWDGSAYHRLATWKPQAPESIRHIAYDTRWPYEYWDEGVLFQFADDPVTTYGIRVRVPEVWTSPTITSSPGEAELGVAWTYAATAEGDDPVWWSLVESPRNARVDFATGEVTWTPQAAGDHAFVLRAANDVGHDEQTFRVVVAPGEDTGATPDSDPPVDSQPDDSEPPGTDPPADCGCASGPAPGAFSLLALLVLARARRGS